MDAIDDQAYNFSTSYGIVLTLTDIKFKGPPAHSNCCQDRTVIQETTPFFQPNPFKKQLGWNHYRKRTYNLPAGQDQSFTSYTALFGILENEKDLLNVESFSISSPTLEDIFLAIIFEADSDPDNIIKKRKGGKEQISPEKNEDEESYADLSTDGQSTSSFPISTPRPNILPAHQSGLGLYGNQATFVSIQSISSLELLNCHFFGLHVIFESDSLY